METAMLKLSNFTA